MANSSNSLPYPGWDIVRRIGGGSFGSVYEIERDVRGWKERAALKVIPIPKENDQIEQLYSEGYDKGSITAYFDDCLNSVVREYGIMAEMKGHPNIVYCDDIRWVQHDDGIGYDVYIKMELLRSLTRWLKEEPARDGAIVGPLDEEGIRKLGKDMCAALIQCRKFEIIHRDIKPDNILVTDSGSFKLGDFGVAKISALTASGTKAGSYNYMSPEVYSNKPYSQQADIYSLGLVLYWLLNERRLPFLPLPPAVPKYEEYQKALDRRMSGERLPEPKNGSDDLKTIVLKACEYEPRRRYATADELLRALETLPEASKEPEPDGLEETIVEETDERKVAPKTAPPPKPEEPPQGPEDDDPPGETPPEEPPISRKRPMWIIKVCVAALVLVIMGAILWGVPRLIAPTAGTISWTLEDGTLTVSGTGPIESAPWKDRADEIRKVVIADGAQSIGRRVFYDCKNLTEVAIPDSVTSIGDYAFFYCENLTSIIIPDSVTSIGFSAFYGCSRLDSISIPSSVTSIADYAFYSCFNLNIVLIPDSVTFIGKYTFEFCPNLTIYAPKGSYAQTYAEENKIRFVDSTVGESGTPLVESAAETPVTESKPEALSWTLEDGTLTISGTGPMESAPWRARVAEINKVVIEDGVQSVGDIAFYNCKNLTGVDMPDSVTSIGKSAFRGCSKLTDITIPDGVITIGERAFQGCTGLTGIEIPASITSIGDSAFLSCAGLTSIDIPSNVMSIGNNAFVGCIHLTSITIPNSVVSIGGNAFRNCYSLTSITIPDSVTSIGNAAFENCTGLTSITIPDSVTSIGERAFVGCTSLTSITIPDSVISFGNYIFDDHTSYYLTIYAPRESYAEKYAEWKGIRFVESKT